MHHQLLEEHCRHARIDITAASYAAGWMWSIASRRHHGPFFAEDSGYGYPLQLDMVNSPPLSSRLIVEGR
ncbi:hypothetical protein [Terracidiphilus sp.]|jgi:hypothetical protein|uniref:hypothetical protein n=1 Tax=Terracidiphilus sp. TaxID=1964191 RepID=UPI003C25AD3F